MLIRKFSLLDLDQILKIEKVSFPNPYPKFYFEELSKAHPESFLVAENEGKILGYVIGRERGGIAEIISIAVDPDWRRKKIGQSLANSLINYVQKKRLKEISLHVRISNQVGILFHQNLGFQILEKIENYYQDGEAAYLMRKEIELGV